MTFSCRLLTIVAIVGVTTTAAMAGYLPVWAFPPAGSGGSRPANAPADGGAQHVPGSTVTLTRKQLAAHGPAVPDWHPEDHPTMPDIVAKGREPQVFACGYCHLPTGAGRPENASLAGLTPGYIKLQLLAFRKGERPGSDPIRGPQTAMIAVAKAVTDAEVEQAAAYFAAATPVTFLKVIETDTVPKTYSVGGIFAKDPGGGTEPIGSRIVEVPEELDRFELRDGRTPFVAYVPVGSLQRGEKLVTTGGDGRTVQCATCHGPDLRGLADIPRLAGRSPSYLMRQLFDLKNGARTGGATVLMKATVANLSEEDMRDIVAYLASRQP